MAEVQLDRVKTWEQTLSETLHGDPGRLWLLPPDDGPRFLGRHEAQLVEWSWPEYLARRTDPQVEVDPPGTWAQLVRDGVLAAHPWLRYPPAEPQTQRPAELEVVRPAIPLSRVLRVLSELLGFDASRRLVSATFERGGVTLEVYAEGPDGRRFAVDGEVARDLIVLPVVDEDEDA